MCAVDVDRNSPLPLWGEATYGVSRHTAREAVRRLAQEGVVVRERGRGTVLGDGRVEQPLDAMYSLFEAVEAGGLEQQSELLAEAEVREPEAAAALGLGEHAELVCIERLRRAGPAPLAVDRVWLPAGIGEALLGTDWSRTSLYEQLAACGTGRPDNGWERVRAIVPSADDAGRLGLQPGEAAFCLERLGRVGDRSVEWRRSLIRADRFAVLTQWAAGQTDASLRLIAYESP
jgi:GntR family transcriptional regulator